MSLDHWVSLVSAGISFVGLLLVVWQLRDGSHRREAESLVEIFDINRELLSLGFSHPELLEVLDGKSADPVRERRYLQLWLNQLSLIHAYLRRSVFDEELETWLERDVADFMMLPNVRRHWEAHGAYYPESFREMVDRILEGPPVQEVRTWRAIFSKVSRDMRTNPSPEGAVSTAPSDGAGRYPCTNTSPLSARTAAGHALFAQRRGMAPFSPMIRVIFMWFRNVFREPELRILVHARIWGRACLIETGAASI